MWQKIKLGDVAKLKNGFAFKSKDYTDEGVPVIRISDINDNLVTTKGAKRVPMKNEYKCYKIEEDSILIAMSGATTGKFGIFRSSEKALQNQRVGKFEYDEDKLSNQFLYYLLYNLKRQILKEAYGGAQPNISSKKIEAMEVEIPSLPIQHRIVEKIEELFSELDNGVENLKKAQKQLKTYRQAVLKDAFEGKLTKEWREQQDDLPTPEELLQQIKAERKAHRQRELAEWEKEVEQWEKDGKPGRKPRKPRKNKEISRLTDSQIEELPELPHGWVHTKLGNIISVSSGSGLTSKEMKGNEHPVYGGNGISGYHNDYIYNEPRLIIGRVGVKCGVTHITKEKSWVTDNALVVDFLTNFSDKAFFKYLIQFEDLNKLSSSTAQPVISGAKIYPYVVSIPTLKEQKEIVNEIESRLSVVDQLEQTIKENLQKAEALRQSILKKAFGGELVN